MSPASLAIDAVLRTVDKGLAIQAAQLVLLREADSDDQHAKIAGALRLVADGLEKHPEPLKLLLANADRYNAEIRMSDPSRWGDVTATQISAAADAFEVAADKIRAAT